MPAGEMYVEGDWKVDDEDREGMKEFSEEHDAERLAREAAEEMEAEEEGMHHKPEEESEEDTEW